MIHKFKNWLIQRGHNSANNTYPGAINRLSIHYSEKTHEQIDLYSLRDTNAVNEIAHKYRRDGIYCDYGSKGNWLYWCAIAKYSEFLTDYLADEEAAPSSARHAKGEIMNKTSELIKIAQNLASNTPEFHSIKGPGIGDHATRAFMLEMKKLAYDAFGHDYSEKRISRPTNFAVDFWFPEEMTVVEFALTLRNASSEFHKDIFKVLLAVDSGEKVDKLVFISKPGAVRRHNEPASKAITNWLKKKYEIQTEIIELK